ncbi:MAG TPA: ABC transporter permease [Solirubrobacterales bacterium]
MGLHRRPGRQLGRRGAADAGPACRDRPRPLRSGDSLGPDAADHRHAAGRRRGLCCLGIALTAAIPSQDAAAPIVNALLLPLYFLSGVFIPDDQLPSGVIHFADIFPIRHFFEAFFDVYDPSGAAGGLQWDNLAVVAVWGVAGLLLAIRFFRWTPRGG